MLELTIWQIIICITFGAILASVYLCLLWQTIRLLPRVKKKGLFLLISAIFRLALLIVLAVFASQNNVGKFLCIIVGFIITRLILVGKFKEHIKERLK